MWQMKKAKLFKHQWIDFALDYKDRAGVQVAQRFVFAVDEALEFIRSNPLACPLYHNNAEDLLPYEFRKWRLKTFPHSIFFRTIEQKTLLIETIYAHRMNISKRLPVDIIGQEDEC